MTSVSGVAPQTLSVRNATQTTARTMIVTGAESPVDGGMTAHGGVTSISDALR